MTLHTIGFRRRSAEDFFTALTNAGVRRLVDVRLNNSSQLAGFSKRDDLRYFLGVICHIEYLHLAELAPTQGLLDEYRSSKNWAAYEEEFLGLMAERKVENLPRETFDGGCLLCSEPTAEHCHRRLVAEYLQGKWDGIEVVHL